jgi:hypothetical protein
LTVDHHKGEFHGCRTTTLQAIAIWNSGFGALLAIAPLALAFRYGQYLLGATPAEPARG